MIAIVDYHAGNLTSVRLAFQTLGCATLVTSSPDEIRAADRVVFPGVGAAYAAMENLRTMELVEAVREAAVTKPFLGICLGMQILFEHSEEDGGVDLLGVLPDVCVVSRTCLVARCQRSGGMRSRQTIHAVSFKHTKNTILSIRTMRS